MFERYAVDHVSQAAPGIALLLPQSPLDMLN